MMCIIITICILTIYTIATYVCVLCDLVHVCMLMCMHACMCKCASMPVSMHLCVYMYVCICVCTGVCTCYSYNKCQVIQLICMHGHKGCTCLTDMYARICMTTFREQKTGCLNPNFTPNFVTGPSPFCSYKIESKSYVQYMCKYVCTYHVGYNGIKHD